MAYPTNLFYTKWTFGFIGGSGQADIQEFGLWGDIQSAGPSPVWATDLQTIADNARDKYIADWPASWFSPGVTAKMVTAYEMDSSLHAVSSAVSVFGSGHTWQGSGSQGLPPQDSVVVTTYGDDPAHYVPHRARRRGRFYLPTMDATMLGADGLLSPTHQTGIVGQALQFLQDMNNLVLTGSNVTSLLVVSRAGTSATPIEYVGVGEIVDTQRKRRNKLVENYSTLGPI